MCDLLQINIVISYLNDKMPINFCIRCKRHVDRGWYTEQSWNSL